MEGVFSKKFIKNLPANVYVVSYRNDNVYLIYKLPWKKRKSNISISFKENHISNSLFEPQIGSSLLELRYMPYHYLEIVSDFVHGNAKYTIKHGLFFNPYEKDDFLIIKKLLSKNAFFFFYDKNGEPAGFDKGGMEWTKKTFLRIDEYPKELRDINLPVADKRCFNPEVVIYYYKDWSKVSQKYRINPDLKANYVFTEDDLKLASDQLWYNFPYIIKNYWDEKISKTAIKYFLKTLDGNDLTEKGAILVKYQSQLLSIILEFINNKHYAQFQNNFHKSIIDFLQIIKPDVDLSKMYFTRTKTFILHEILEIQKSNELHIKECDGQFCAMISYIWAIVYSLYCVHLGTGSFAYVDNFGGIFKFKFQKHQFFSFRDVIVYLESLSQQMIWSMGVSNFEQLIEPNDDFSISSIYDELPLIENAQQIFKDVLKSALKFREYFITEPSEVLVENKIFKSLTFYDCDFTYCVCKIRTQDGKISFGLINKMSMEFDWSLWEKFSIQHTATIAALCCAIYRDFSVSETRLYKKSDIKTLKKASKKSENDKRIQKIIYLPRFKTKYIDDSPIIKNIDRKLNKIVERKGHDVTAHLRKVKVACSKVQIDLAKEYGIEIPLGYTFVRQHYRSGTRKETIYKSRFAFGLLIEASRKSLSEVQDIITEARVVHNDDLQKAHEDLKDWKNILNSFEEFELFVKDLINKMGVEAKTTQKSYDGGIDIVAHDNRGFAELKYVFQCKFYSTNNTVGVGDVRALLGVKTADSTIDKAILVTSSTFSPEAKKFASSNSIALIDGENLFQIVTGLSDKPLTQNI